MNDNLYNTQINEIEGEIASLKITLKNTTDKTRAKELEEEIKQLEEQLEDIKKNFKKSYEGFRDRYKAQINDEIVLPNGASTDDYFDYLGPTGPSSNQEHEEIG